MILNELWLCDCVQGLQRLEADSIDLTVTSPPWDNVFDYGGHEWNLAAFQCVAEELFRVTKPGGLVCWDIADSVQDGILTGTVYRHGLYFMDLGFYCWEKLVVHRNCRIQASLKRHGTPPEEVLIFSKGRPSTFHRQLKPNRSQYVGTRRSFSHRRKDGVLTHRLGSPIREMGLRNSIWCYAPTCPKCQHLWDGTLAITGQPVFDGADGVVSYPTHQPPRHYTRIHPARMSAALVNDLISAYSEPGMIVLDPFMGTGTTCEMALLNNRFFLGMEIHRPYFAVAERRMRDAKEKYFGHRKCAACQPV